jgi:hypothetical protein
MQNDEINEMLDARGSRYGAFVEHARITQAIKSAMQSGQSWKWLSLSQKEALEMVAHKIGRIVNGDPDYDDSWVDIVGYVQLARVDMAAAATLQQKQELALKEAELKSTIVTGD